MKALEYLNFLSLATSESTQDLALRQESLKTWQKLRVNQIEEASLADSYEKYIPNLETENLNQFQTNTLNQHIYDPFKDALPANIRAAIADIPVGVLPISSINACSAKAPAGDSLVIFNRGLLTMVKTYVEARISFMVIDEKYGFKPATIYLWKMYEFIMQCFEHDGKLNYPEQVIKMPFALKLMMDQIAVAVETFVLAHELAHAYLGHLENRSTRSINVIPNESVEFYQLSQEQELEADQIGWMWYQNVWKSIPFLSTLDSSMAQTAPFYLFGLLAFVEKNSSTPTDYSTHPPASKRLASLIYNSGKLNDPKFLGQATYFIEITKTAPTLGPGYLEMMLSLMDEE